jgi:hypothetical protein
MLLTYLPIVAAQKGEYISATRLIANSDTHQIGLEKGKGKNDDD